MKVHFVCAAVIGLMVPITACQQSTSSLAPIQNVSINISAADPLADVTVTIEYGLPDSCYSFDKKKLTEITDGFDIGVWIKKPISSEACDLVFTTETVTVDLGNKFSPGQSYTIRVNGEDRKITIPEAGADPNITIKPAVISKVDVRIAESFPPQVFIDIQGVLTDSCTTLNNVDTKRQGTVINITVTTQRPKDAICAQVISYFSTTVPLGSDFVSGQVYTLRVNGQEQQFNVDGNSVPTPGKPTPTTSPTAVPPDTRPIPNTVPGTILPPTIITIPGGSGGGSSGSSTATGIFPPLPPDSAGK